MSMFKSAKVNYPKKRIKVTDLKVIGVPEPIRKTMYDIVVNNFQIAGRKTFLNRIIYIGEHCFFKYEALVNFFTETVTNANSHRHTLEKLTGILIKYQRHFIHLLEGDEDVIYEHIRLILNNDQYSNVLENIKLLAIIHHINCRYASDWTCISGTPPHLLEKIDPASPIEVVGSVTYGCILKIYDILVKMDKVNASASELEESFSDDNVDSLLSTDIRSSIHSQASCAPQYSLRYSKMTCESSMRTILSRSNASYADPVMLSLPEIDTLHFLIRTPHTKNLKDVLIPYRNVEQRDIYKDKVWPIAADFIPYDVYSKAFDMQTAFPQPGGNVVVEATDDGVSMLLWEAEGEDANIRDSSSDTNKNEN